MRQAKTEIGKFKQYLRGKGFDVVPSKGIPGHFVAFHTVPAEHRVNEKGDHYLLSRIDVACYPGSNTKKGEVGTFTMAFIGTYRRRGGKNILDGECMKVACCPVTAETAINNFEQWEKEGWAIFNSWKRVL